MDVGREMAVDALHAAREVHVLQVDGQWRWVLTNESYENYRSGDCGIATAPSPGYEA